MLLIQLFKRISTNFIPTAIETASRVDISVFNTRTAKKKLNSHHNQEHVKKGQPTSVNKEDRRPMCFDMS